ncbi:5'-methylthioadenosine/S-adenosylhomocysteine nucleosidase [Madurella mycetomatis]|uniref:5'-methylthioadenosine/S-adenosylhomocysteine nucleosidase n=1 Tax=Madurella mycetomatis TaxID=100816 RepID=A0A175VR04_9PEZI|nr:5'-methylthioadenosine/S-adenosylhomocysteine nucleosidase [Madurella mycetomatis]KXX74218.1 5'-methylthioadenosine/S-adenosylhomocysteine nucleosidase [Madurella mycetomatis]
MGKHTDEEFKIFSHLNKAHDELLYAIQPLRSDHRRERKMDGYIDEVMRKSKGQSDPDYFAFPGQEHDRLFQSDYPHPPGQPSCADCDEKCAWNRPPRAERSKVFYGTIGCANNVLRSAKERDRLHRKEGILCVEMEAAGMMDTLPSLVVRGVCDYADSHKNKRWQPYAALAAAAYTKELLTYVKKAPPAREHGDHCYLGTVRLDAVNTALAADSVQFRRDLAELVNIMSDVNLHFIDVRLRRFYEFLRKHNLPHPEHWVATDQNQLFDGYNASSAIAARENPQKEPRERLRAARAFAFIRSNERVLTTTYLVQDTVLRMWDYVESEYLRYGRHSRAGC